MFSSRSFMVSCVIFKSLSHFEFICVYGVRVCSSFIDLHGTIQCCFYLLAVVNNVSVNIFICWSSCFHSFVYIPRSGIAGSYSSSMFNFSRNHDAVLHSGCTILQLHQQCTRVLISLHLYQHLLFSVLFGLDWFWF